MVRYNSSFKKPMYKPKELENQVEQEIQKYESLKRISGLSFLEEEDQHIKKTFDEDYINNPIGTYKSSPKKVQEPAKKTQSPMKKYQPSSQIKQSPPKKKPEPVKKKASFETTASPKKKTKFYE